MAASLGPRSTRACAGSTSWGAVLAGIGFTVSLLIGELAFGSGSERDKHVKVGVRTGSMLAAGLAAIIVRARDRACRRLRLEEERDTDRDGIRDVYEATR